MTSPHVYSSKIAIMSFWAPAPKSPAKNGIPKKPLDTSLILLLQLYLHVLLIAVHNTQSNI